MAETGIDMVAKLRNMMCDVIGEILADEEFLNVPRLERVTAITTVLIEGALQTFIAAMDKDYMNTLNENWPEFLEMRKETVEDVAMIAKIFVEGTKYE